MTDFIRHLQRQAQRIPKPKEFMKGDPDMDMGEPLRDSIMTGRVQMMGIPVRVEGVELVPKLGS